MAELQTLQNEPEPRAVEDQPQRVNSRIAWCLLCAQLTIVEIEIATYSYMRYTVHHELEIRKSWTIDHHSYQRYVLNDFKGGIIAVCCLTLSLVIQELFIRQTKKDSRLSPILVGISTAVFVISTLLFYTIHWYQIQHDGFGSHDHSGLSGLIILVFYVVVLGGFLVYLVRLIIRIVKLCRSSN